MLTCSNPVILIVSSLLHSLSQTFTITLPPSFIAAGKIILLDCVYKRQTILHALVNWFVVAVAIEGCITFEWSVFWRIESNSSGAWLTSRYWFIVMHFKWKCSCKLHWKQSLVQKSILKWNILARCYNYWCCVHDIIDAERRWDKSASIGMFFFIVHVSNSLVVYFSDKHRCNEATHVWRWDKM